MAETVDKETAIEFFKLKELELRKEGGLMLSNVEIEGYSCYKLFIKDFITKFNLDKNVNTLNQDGSIQCMYNKNRSFGDLFRIALNYFDNVDLIDLITFICMNVNKDIRILYCPDIKKIVISNFLRLHGYTNFEEFIEHDNTLSRNFSDDIHDKYVRSILNS